MYDIATAMLQKKNTFIAYKALLEWFMKLHLKIHWSVMKSHF